MPHNLKIVTVLAPTGGQRTAKQVERRIDGHWVPLTPVVGTRLEAIALRNYFQARGF